MEIKPCQMPIKKFFTFSKKVAAVCQRHERKVFNIEESGFFEKDELAIALNEIEHSTDDMMHGLFKIKYYVEKIRAQEVL